MVIGIEDNGISYINVTKIVGPSNKWNVFTINTREILEIKDYSRKTDQIKYIYVFILNYIQTD